jgi:hypothetical protein
MQGNLRRVLEQRRRGGYVEQSDAGRDRRGFGVWKQSYGFPSPSILFVTKSGSFGLGLAQTAFVMSIYLISGLAIPFILEKTPGAEGFYLCGECYMEGCMD